MFYIGICVGVIAALLGIVDVGPLWARMMMSAFVCGSAYTVGTALLQ